MLGASSRVAKDVAWRRDVRVAVGMRLCEEKELGKQGIRWRTAGCTNLYGATRRRELNLHGATEKWGSWQG